MGGLRSVGRRRRRGRRARDRGEGVRVRALADERSSVVPRRHGDRLRLPVRRVRRFGIAVSCSSGRDWARTHRRGSMVGGRLGVATDRGRQPAEPRCHGRAVPAGRALSAVAVARRDRRRDHHGGRVELANRGRRERMGGRFEVEPEYQQYVRRIDETSGEIFARIRHWSGSTPQRGRSSRALRSESCMGCRRRSDQRRSTA